MIGLHALQNSVAGGWFGLIYTAYFGTVYLAAVVAAVLDERLRS